MEAGALDAAPDHVAEAGTGDAGASDACAGDCPASAIQHVVIIVQENHTFDDHFGGYCTAAPGSNPTCNTGPSCCEAMPAKDPTGVKPTVLTDMEHGQWDPNHQQICEEAEIDNGQMDGYATASPDGGGSPCGSPENVAIADPTIVQPYWTLAASGALGDRYFQSVAGASSSNDMYLATARFVFADNDFSPQGATGTKCDIESTPAQYTTPNLGDLLNEAHVSWNWFYEGYAAMVQANGVCPPRPNDCPFTLPFYPCAMDPSDVPFEYFKSLVNTSFIQDLSVMTDALMGKGTLPAVSFVKALGYKSEHPGTNITLSAGVQFTAGLIQAIQTSAYGKDTLILVTYDESGGYFDHVAPPANSTVDDVPYGPRIPLMAVGPYVRKNWISHVPMEHSSLVKFIEWNWLGQKTGQLGGRDAVVANIGSILDPTTTGIPVPAN
jgi:phospholipase C